MSTPVRMESRLEGKETAVLSLAGELDVANVAQVREAALKLLAGDIKRLVVDLSSLEYIDSSGLGVLIGLHKRQKESGGTLAIAGARPRVRRVLEITGLERILALYDDAAAALKEVV